MNHWNFSEAKVWTKLYRAYNFFLHFADIKYLSRINIAQ